MSSSPADNTLSDRSIFMWIRMIIKSVVAPRPAVIDPNVIDRVYKEHQKEGERDSNSVGPFCSMSGHYVRLQHEILT
jgi:hypothetical protein